MAKKILSCFAFSLLFSLFSLNCFADSSESPIIQISPISSHISLARSETAEYGFTIENPGKVPYSFKVYTGPYRVLDENYNIDFNNKTYYNEIVDWILFKNSDGEYVKSAIFTIQPGEQITINYTISAPDAPLSGGQYATIFAETVNENDSAIRAVSRVSLVVYAHTGNSNLDGNILEINVQSFKTSGLIDGYVYVENTGDTDFSMNTTIQIKNLSGKMLFSDLKTAYILPQTKRKYNFEWEKTPFMGIFNVSITASILGKTETKEFVVLILPIFAIIIFVLFIIAIIYWIIYFVRRKASKKY